MCFCFCFRSSLPCPQSYADFIANIALLFSVPCVLCVLVFNTIPVFLWILFSYCGCCDCFAHIFWFIAHTLIAYPINLFEKFLIYSVCVVLHPIAFCLNYSNNKKVIDFVRENSNSKDTKYHGEDHCQDIHVRVSFLAFVDTAPNFS
jgi:hypothetical protein